MYFSSTLKIKIKLNHTHTPTHPPTQTHTHTHTHTHIYIYLRFKFSELLFGFCVERNNLTYSAIWLLALPSSLFYEAALSTWYWYSFAMKTALIPHPPHDPCLLSSVNTSVTTVNLIYVVQVFFKNIPRIGISVLSCSVLTQSANLLVIITIISSNILGFTRI